MKPIRAPAVAGTFYDGDPERLREMTANFLDRADPEPMSGEIIGLISPHAGFPYSGQGAAFGYRLLTGDGIRRAIILAPSHRHGFSGVALTDAAAYRTPLGDIPVDTPACEALAGEPEFETIPEAHAAEHSLEVQLPFLQVALRTEIQLVPLIVGQLDPGAYSPIAKALRRIIRPGDLVIASSDFTHQGPRFGYQPYRTNVAEKIRELDMGAVDPILALDRPGFIQYVRDTGATICGAHPIGVLLETLPEGTTGRLLKYYTSGDITGDHTDSVSYATIAFSRPEGWA